MQQWQKTYIFYVYEYFRDLIYTGVTDSEIHPNETLVTVMT